MGWGKDLPHAMETKVSNTSICHPRPNIQLPWVQPVKYFQLGFEFWLSSAILGWIPPETSSESRIQEPIFYLENARPPGGKGRWNSAGLPCQWLHPMSSREATGEQYCWDQGVPATMASFWYLWPHTRSLSLILLPFPWFYVSPPRNFPINLLSI